ncbi:MAG: hypothetical protein AABW92_03065 [Nanoarchaeota archaeon]
MKKESIKLPNKPTKLPKKKRITEKKEVKSSFAQTIMKKLENQDYNKLFPVLAILLVSLALYNVFILSGSGILLDEKIATAKELARPGEIQTIEISFDCEGCYQVGSIVDQIKSLDVNVTSEQTFEYNSDEAKSLIQEYNIKKVPTLIVKGEINKSTKLQTMFNSYGEQFQDAMVVNKQFPLYYDLDDGRIVGKVSLTQLRDSSCKYCKTPNSIISVLGQSGIVFSSERNIDVSSQEGQQLVKRFSITQVPTIILDNEASYYDGFESTWSSVGTKNEGYFILRSLNLPYKDLATGKEVGVVHLTLLNDGSCQKCYDVNVHKEILSRYGMTFATEKTIDVSSNEGKALVEKYSITKVPTTILSEGASAYPSLVNVWKQVGSVEKDGNFVFRNIDAMGKVTYKNLGTGGLVNG